MATNPRDVKDLSPAIGALLVNFGTITDKEGMMVAGREANVNRKPVVFDPVAVGATSYRRETSKGEPGLELRDRSCADEFNRIIGSLATYCD